ncbi:MAG TPA: dihydropteroate synthase [Methanocorpusculum sp.]|nr:dihydropteroate synthase [Methanocorpusculum sp.]
MQIGKIRIAQGQPKILGVLNISPESFFTDSFTPIRQLLHRVEQMRRDGADIIDLGARSTALNALPLSVAEEKSRVTAALAELKDADIPFSLDTMHAEVLEAALRFDIAAVNDISGLLHPAFAHLAADSGLPVICMASQKTPGDALSFAETKAACAAVLDRAAAYEIENLILDPGVGRWSEARTSEADWELCRRFGELKTFGRPLLAAVSRKAFIGTALGREPQERLAGTLGVEFALCEAGADLLRVHDVAAARDIIAVFEKLRR